MNPEAWPLPRKATQIGTKWFSTCFSLKLCFQTGLTKPLFADDQSKKPVNKTSLNHFIAFYALLFNCFLILNMQCYSNHYKKA